MTELVACAAIQADQIIMAGKRHHNCLAMLRLAGISHIGREFGFMTTHGRFVNRIEARRIHEAAGLGSADPGGFRGDGLFSEDLY